jgi:hypothetical protein
MALRFTASDINEYPESRPREGFEPLVTVFVGQKRIHASDSAVHIPVHNTQSTMVESSSGVKTRGGICMAFPLAFI